MTLWCDELDDKMNNFNKDLMKSDELMKDYSVMWWYLYTNSINYDEMMRILSVSEGN